MDQALAPAKIQFPAKLQGLFGPWRYKVAHGGRGSGKSWNFARALLLIAAQRKVRVLCARELQKSIAESVHKLLSDQIEEMGLSSQYTIEQASIRSSVGSEFFFEGIRNNVKKIKSYEGADYCWVEEADSVPAESWQVLIPTMRKKGSEIWVTFNPELETDATYQMFCKNSTPDMLVVEMNWRDNEWFPEELEKERLKLKAADLDSYLHVWEGKCRQNLVGAVYEKELQAAELDKRLTKCPYDPIVGVETFWDLGIADMTAIWFVQRVGYEIHLIDYYENCGYGLDHYLGILQARKYIYNTLWLPHDARAREKGTGKSIEELARAKGHRVRIVPKLKVYDGINAVRTIFPKLVFDLDNTAQGVFHLRRYRYEMQREHGQATGSFTNNPKHDEHSHAADALRGMGVGLKEPKRNVMAGVKERLGFAPKPLAQTLGWLR